MFKGLSSLDVIFKNTQSISLIEGDKYKLNNSDLIIKKLEDFNKENVKIEEKQNEKIEEKQNEKIEEKPNEKIEEKRNENLVNNNIIKEQTKPKELINQDIEEIKEKKENNLKKYPIITNPNSTISLPKDYSTDIEKEKELIDLYNEDHLDRK